MKKQILLLPYFLLLTIYAYSSGLKGYIQSEEGVALAYATIFVKETNDGTVTNSEGYYEIDLTPGDYTISFQYIGYKTEVRKISIAAGTKKSLNLKLPTQILELNTLEISSNREDPAYTLMRKAIAKASYHREQIERYSAKIYLKGSNRLLKNPKLFNKIMEEEGIDSTTAFLEESISQISYQRPNIYSQKVLHIRQQGEDTISNPNQYLQISFYEPQIGQNVSPLSPKAMAYYRFEFMGSYWENDIEVNKIKVIPRKRGIGVFEGTISIVEGGWNIHSLHLSTSIIGVGGSVSLEQIYQLIDKKAWLPISHKIVAEAKMFGFGFSYDYIATVNDYEIELNPDLQEISNLIDEKIEIVAAEQTQGKEKKELAELMASEEELTTKDLRKLMKIYAKEERKKQEDPNLSSVRNLEIDSSAYGKDTAFWKEIRPVPLTVYEVNSYERSDSLELIQQEEDSTEINKNSKFGIFDLIGGGKYKIGERNHIIYQAPLQNSNFNTVEGYYLGTDLGFQHEIREERFFKLGGMPRYSFARDKLLGKGYLSLDIGKQGREGNILLEGGSFIAQINDHNPIHSYINAFHTLLLQENYMKILEKNFLKVQIEKQIVEKLTIKFTGESASRTRLENDEEVEPWIGSREKFTPNLPFNVETDGNAFEDHQVFKINFGLEWRPWQRYRLFNGEKEFFNRAPSFFVNYSKGSGDADYDFLEGGIQYRWNRLDGSYMNIKAVLGTFLNDDQVYFPDFKHFTGNRTIFATADPIESFRLLDYYTFSTKESFAEAHVYYQFRSLFITQIPLVSIVGFKENLFTNYLQTPAAGNYMEVGYGLEYLLFRLEAVASFQDFSYRDFGVLIGLSVSLFN